MWTGYSCSTRRISVPPRLMTSSSGCGLKTTTGAGGALGAASVTGRPGCEQEGGVGVLLQETGGDGVGHRPLDGLLHDRRLVLAERQQDDALGLEDGADAHGQGLVRHVLLAEEAAGGVAARHGVEGGEAG